MLVDFDYSKFPIRSYENWKQKADSAKIAFAPFGGGPYFGYEVGVIDAMHELGIAPDAYLPGCVGNFIAMYHLMAVTENRDPTYYIDQFSNIGLMKEKDYLKAPIPPLFPMRVSQWMRALVGYYSKPDAYRDLIAPELFPDVVNSWVAFLKKPTERNLGLWTRNLMVWNPLSRLALGGYFFAPIGPFGELYDYDDPEGWIHPGITWNSVYSDQAPIYMMSLLEVGADDVHLATNCLDHPEFDPVDGRRLASASNLPWLIAETHINGKWYRESAVRDVATINAKALDTLPSLDTIIAVQIMAAPAADRLSIKQGNHNNYALQVTEMISTIGDDDITQAKDHLEETGRTVEWITIEATEDSQPFWTFENMERCRREGYTMAMHKFENSANLKKLIKPSAAAKKPAARSSKVVKLVTA